MNRFSIVAAVALAAVSANLAFGHGFRLTTDNGKLVLTSEDPTAGGLPIYKVQSLLGPATFKSADHPGYEVQSGIGSGALISFDVLGPLWYSTGGEPVPSPVDMLVTPQDIFVPGSVTVTGDSGFQTGFLIGEYDGSSLGAFEHQLSYAISVPAGVPLGAYALAMQLTGFDALGQPYTPSDPFVAVFNNGMPVGNLPAVAALLYTAAIPVPEPSSIVLAALATLGVTVIGRRARRNRSLTPTHQWVRKFHLHKNKSEPREIHLMNMRSLLAALVVAAAPATVFAHGLHQSIHVTPAGAFQSSAVAYYGFDLDPVGEDDSVFEPGSYTVNAIVTNSLQYTAAFAASDPPNGIAIGSTWGFDLVGPLLYWEPVGGFSDAPVTATIVRSGLGFDVDKDSVFVAGGNLAAGGGYNGNIGFHNAVTVNLPLAAPAGLYAVGFEVRSTGTTPYDTSNVFYAIGTNGLSEADFNRGIEAFEAIGVPEPSSVVLMVLGSLGLVALGWRKRCKLAHA